MGVARTLGMKRLLDEPSVVHFSSGDDIGDYAFHELPNSEAWFVDELPDGRARWEALPASHPLSMAWLHRRPQAMAMIPPPLPRLKVPLLEKPSVRVTLLGTIVAAFIGLVSMGVRSTRAAEPPPVAAAAAPAEIPAQAELAASPKTTPSLESQYAAIPYTKAPETKAPAVAKARHHKKHASHKRHKIARR
jgi:hypothetical protein